MNTSSIETESVLSNGHIYPEFLPIGSWYVNEWGKAVTVVSHRFIEPMTPDEMALDIYEQVNDI